MGYSTDYILETIPPIDSVALRKMLALKKSCEEASVSLHPEVAEFFERPENMAGCLLNNNENASFALGPFLDGGEACKWYEHEVEMSEVSSACKGVLFILHGIGESNGDLWRKYFKNGRMQAAVARIEYDDFDEKKLK